METGVGKTEISGAIDGLGDSDLFELILKPGTQYRVTVRGEVSLNVFSEDLPDPRNAAEEAFQNILTPVFNINGQFSSTFVAQQGTSYFAEVQTRFNSLVDPLPYTLEITEVMDDAAAGVQTTVSVGLGGTFEGRYDTLGDQDWVKLNVQAGTNYLASVSAAFGDGMFLVAYDRVTGEQVDLPFVGANSTTTTQVGFSARAGVDYFAVLQDGSAFGSNDYTFSLTSLVGDTASDSTTTANVDPGSSVQGLISTFGDYDWIRLNVSAGDSYAVNLSFPSLRSTAGGFNLIELNTATGEVLEVQNSRGALATNDLTFSAKAGSSYFVEVIPDPGAALNGLYQIDLTQFADDFADNTSTTGRLSTTTPVTMSFDAANEFDFVRLVVDAGKSYEVTSSIFVTSGFRIVRSDQLQLDPTPNGQQNKLSFMDPRVDANVFNTNKARIDVEAGFDYYLVASPPTLSQVVPLTFTLAEVTPETLDNPNTAASISNNQTIVGQSETQTDQDWIKLNLVAGESAQLTIVNTRQHHIFAVKNDGTVELLTEQDFIQSGGLTVSTVVTGRSDAMLFLQVSGNFATYSLSMAPVADDFLNDQRTAAVIGGPNVATRVADILEGTGSADRISAFGGNDSVSGLNGNDTLLGGLGDDTIKGGSGADTLNGGAGSDSLVGGNGADSILGGDSNDIAFGNAGEDTLNGQSGNDTLNAGSGNDNLVGGDGNDSILGGGGYDTIFGGNGRDTVNGGDGRDSVFLGAGNDLFVDNGQGGVNGRDTVFGGSGNDTINGGNGNDRFEGQNGNDLLLGRLGNDVLFGGGNNDTLNGGDGNDTVNGGNGRDRAFLGNGNDRWFDNSQSQVGDDFVQGGNGNDWIQGGGGDDTLTGGAGADTFVFAANIDDDQITDYMVDTDQLQFKASLWNGALTQARLNALTEVVGPDLVFSFDNGDTLTLNGVTSTAGLLDEISLI